MSVCLDPAALDYLVLLRRQTQTFYLSVTWMHIWMDGWMDCINITCLLTQLKTINNYSGQFFVHPSQQILHIQAYELHHDLPLEAFVFLRSHKGSQSKYTSVGVTERAQ